MAGTSQEALSTCCNLWKCGRLCNSQGAELQGTWPIRPAGLLTPTQTLP